MKTQRSQILSKFNQTDSQFQKGLINADNLAKEALQNSEIIKNRVTFLQKNYEKLIKKQEYMNQQQQTQQNLRIRNQNHLMEKQRFYQDKAEKLMCKSNEIKQNNQDTKRNLMNQITGVYQQSYDVSQTVRKLITQKKVEHQQNMNQLLQNNQKQIQSLRNEKESLKKINLSNKIQTWENHRKDYQQKVQEKLDFKAYKENEIQRYQSLEQQLIEKIKTTQISISNQSR